MKTRQKAYAKLNISLDVIRKRVDGYHDLEMVMQSASLADDITLELIENGIEISTNRHYIPNDERNIAAKAAKAFFAEVGYTGGVRINIEKRIPVCAGLGGGSSDAAAVLRGLNELLKAEKSAEDLRKISEHIGSDVPFCVEGGLCLASGKGEVLEDLGEMESLWVLICMPHFSVSTPELFSKVDKRKLKLKPDTKGIVKAIQRDDVHDVAVRMYNVFEDVLDKRSAQIVGKIKRDLLDNGAIGSVMSGTGSAVYGFFKDKETAEKAEKSMKTNIRETFVCKTIGKCKV